MQGFIRLMLAVTLVCGFAYYFNAGRRAASPQLDDRSASQRR
jgi:hypothetical protein